MANTTGCFTFESSATGARICLVCQTGCQTTTSHNLARAEGFRNPAGSTLKSGGKAEFSDPGVETRSDQGPDPLSANPKFFCMPSSMGLGNGVIQFANHAGAAATSSVWTSSARTLCHTTRELVDVRFASIGSPDVLN
eukprot:c15280_g1_i1.p1 GENE.c15280_g1_i1~~c15280_g1_i1.p1  ORF type:complete len:152 (+),score=14.01 c15280_g1_i1:44-457(+)